MRETSVPSGATTIAVLKPRPSAASARSYSEAWTWTPDSAAARRAKDTVGPDSSVLGLGAGRLRPVRR